MSIDLFKEPKRWVVRTILLYACAAAASGIFFVIFAAIYAFFIHR